MSTAMPSKSPIKRPRAGYQPPLNPDRPPPRINRRDGAQLLFDKLGMKVSSRTLEEWPLKARLVNGRATYDTAELLAFAREKIEAAPAIRGGRKRS